MSKACIACTSILVTIVSIASASAQTAAQQRVIKNTAFDRSTITTPVATTKVPRLSAETISDISEFVRAKLNSVRSSYPIAPVVKNDSETQETAAAAENPSFLLKALTFDHSHYLDDKIFSEINRQLAGRPINLPVLSAVPDIVNEIYAAVGVLTGNAVLRPQTSENGVIHVSLFEPVVGEVRVDEVGRTRASYIKNRIGVSPGERPDFAELAEDLFEFSTLNNMNLTAKFEPTDSPNVVDVVLHGEKTKEVSFSLASDNYGASETGLERLSSNYQHINFLGYRDILSVSGIFAEGINTGSVNYSFPIGFVGSRISAGITHSESRVINGPLVATNLESQSTTGVVSFQHPVAVEPNRIGWFGISGNIEYLRSQVSGVELTDTTVKEFYFFTNWLWRQPTYTAAFNIQLAVGDAQSEVSTSTDGGFQYIQGGFDLVGSIAETLAYKVNFDAKFGLSRNNPTSVLHSVGGVETVRGYPVSLLTGDSGFNITLETSLFEPWTFDLSPNTTVESISINPFTFADLGIAVPFRNTSRAIQKEDVIASIGFGLNYKVGSHISGDVSVGIPFRDTTGFDASHEGPVVNFKLVASF